MGVSLLEILKKLSDMFPNPSRDVPSMYDLIPPRATLALFATSAFLPVMTRLLVNDSLMDLSSRSELYFAALHLVDLRNGTGATYEVI
ncbi:hypothetical protein HK405_003517 [Cladochytrium tenue]|nr:hypothetical protein HK405_003517 [Cladochytrium tenue]